MLAGRGCPVKPRFRGPCPRHSGASLVMLLVMGGPRKSKPAVATTHVNTDPLVANLGHKAGNARPDVKSEFIEWLATPKKQRDAGLKTYQAFADAYGVDRSTLYHWKRDPRVMREVYKVQGRSVQIDQLADIVEAQSVLARSGESGSTQAARFVVEMMEKTMTIDEAAAETDVLEEMSLEELQAKMVEYQDHIADLIDLKAV